MYVGASYILGQVLPGSDFSIWIIYSIIRNFQNNSTWEWLPESNIKMYSFSLPHPHEISTSLQKLQALFSC